MSETPAPRKLGVDGDGGRLDGRDGAGIERGAPCRGAGGTFALAIRNVGTCSFTPDALRNCTSTCDGIPVSRTQAGAVVGSYQYRRYQTGASPPWTPLRFPGQYYDAETDLAENWRLTDELLLQ